MSNSDIDYYDNYYIVFLKEIKYTAKVNIWLEFAKWLLNRFDGGTITNPTNEGLEAWNKFYKQMSDKNKYNMDILIVRANDNVQRHSLDEPVLERNENYEIYKANMIKRQQAAAAYKKQMSTVYNGFLSEDNIDCIGAEDSDFMTQREWMAADERRRKHEKWLADNKEKFIVEAFTALDSTIEIRRDKYKKRIAEACEAAESWDLAIPASKKEKTELAKKLKTEWRFKDAISGLTIVELDSLLMEKIANHKADLVIHFTKTKEQLINFERIVELWEQYRSLGLEELNELNTYLRKEEKPVLSERTSVAIKIYNEKMSVLNEKLKIINKLIQMNMKGIRCMDDYRSCVGGIGDYFEF